MIELQPTPLDLGIPDYYQRDAEDLAANELAIYDRLHAVSLAIAKQAFDHLYTTEESLEVLEEYKDEAVILAPTHRDFLDIPAVGVLIDRAGFMPAHYAAKAELFPAGVKRPVAWLLGHLGGLPIDREYAKSSAQAVDPLRKLVKHSILSERRSAVIYPDGTRKEGDIVEELQAGAVLFGARNKAPVIPVGIAGTEGGLKRLKKGRRCSAALVVGQVIEPSRKVKENNQLLAKRLQDAQYAARELLEQAA